MASPALPSSVHNPASGLSPPDDWGDLINDHFIYLAADLQSYTPSNGGITVGNGTLAGLYKEEYGMAFFKWFLLFGTTTAITGTIAIGLPFTSKNDGMPQTFPVYMNEFTVRHWIGLAMIGGGATQATLFHTEAGGSGVVNATNPFTWGGANDAIYCSGWYDIN